MMLAAGAQAQTAEFDYFKDAGNDARFNVGDRQDVTSTTTQYRQDSIQTHLLCRRATPIIW